LKEPIIDEKIHWDLLRYHLSVFIVCAGLACALGYHSSARFDRVDDTYRAERRNFDQLARDYRTAIQEEAVYRAHVDQFEQFTENGYIGEERRLSWIEALQDVNRELKLPVLKYDIRPRQAFELRDTDFVLNEKITLYESVMQLNLGLLHGGDLFVFLSELKKRASGLFEVRACDLRLASTELQFDAQHPNVNALCQLAWYTVGVEAGREPLEQ
jgi:hypothetical protein